METRELAENEYSAALELAWNVFCEYEAPDYSQQGVESFNTAIHDLEYIAQLRIYGAYEGNNLVGVLATRNAGTHIALFFVKGCFHRKSVGKRLFSHACTDNTSGKLTVNSSPYAVDVYKHLGFHAIESELTTDGIRYTPMECVLQNQDCPCKRSRCKRHGNCMACLEHHKTKKNGVACGQTAKKS